MQVGFEISSTDPVLLDMVAQVLHKLLVSHMFTPSYPLHSVIILPSGCCKDNEYGDLDPYPVVHTNTPSLLTHALAVMGTGSTSLTGLLGLQNISTRHLLQRGHASMQVCSACNPAQSAGSTVTILVNLGPVPACTHS
jgi:hypothetical protein